MRQIVVLVFLWMVGVSSLFAFEKWHFNLGAELYMPKPSGTFSNVASGETTFGELGFSKSTYASIFHFDIQNDYDYIPNIKLSYFNFIDTQHADLNKTIQVAREDFTGQLQSQIDYSVTSFLLYKGILLQGSYVSIFSFTFYTGDLEFQLGIDTKLLQWKYSIFDRGDLSRSPAWVQAQAVVPQVYFSANYYFYNLVLEAQTSNLAISDSKIIEYSLDAKYLFGDALYLKVGYLYSNIQVVHNNDEIDYKATGMKVGFEYLF